MSVWVLNDSIKVSVSLAEPSSAIIISFGRMLCLRTLFKTRFSASGQLYVAINNDTFIINLVRLCLIWQFSYCLKSHLELINDVLLHYFFLFPCDKYDKQLRNVSFLLLRC